MKKRCSTGLGFLIVALVAGCSPSPSTTDPASARSVVDEALTAWKDSATVQKVREQSNSIIVAEPRWEAGWKLDGYEIVEQVVDGFHARCKVRLSMTDPQGKSAKEAAEYLTTTNPKRTVTRVSEGW